MKNEMETAMIGYIGCTLGLYWDNGKENGNYYIVYWCSFGIMENERETAI